jgi:hypothetical protein
MDPVLITSIIGFSVMFVERLFHYLGRVKKTHFHSECCGKIKIDYDKEMTEKKSNE